MSCEVPFQGLPGSNSGTESSDTNEGMDCIGFDSDLRTSLARTWFEPSDHPPTTEEGGSLDQVGSGRGRTEMAELVFGTVDPGAREKGESLEGVSWSESLLSKVGNFHVVLRRDCEESCFSEEVRSRKSEDSGEESEPGLKSNVELGCPPTGLDGMLPDPTVAPTGNALGGCVCFMYIAWFTAI